MEEFSAVLQLEFKCLLQYRVTMQEPGTAKTLDITSFSRVLGEDLTPVFKYC